MAGPLVLVTLRKMLLSSELLKVLCHLELCEGRNILTTLLGLPTYAAPLAKRGDLTTAILQSAMSSYAQEIEADAKERARFITSAMQKQMLASFVSRMESLLEVVATLEIEPGFQMDAQLMPILLQLQPKFQAPGQRFQGGGAAGAAGQGGGAAGAAGQGGGAAGGVEAPREAKMMQHQETLLQGARSQHLDPVQGSRQVLLLLRVIGALCNR